MLENMTSEKVTSEQRLRELPKAVIKWYGFGKGSRIACLVHDRGNSGLIAEALEEEGGTERVFLDRLDNGYEGGRYDFVVAVDVLEYAKDPAELLIRAKRLLKPEGTLLVAADNRLGIRYFCGDQDYFTGRSYDSIEDYRHVPAGERKAMEGRAYSRAELAGVLERAGFWGHRFFSVFPRISNPQILLAEDYEPNEALDIRVFPEYNSPGTVFLFEEELYPALMENRLLHPMANGFFIECPLDLRYTPVNQVTLSGERGAENAMATVIRSDGLVEKRALYPAGRKKLGQLMENHKYLSAHGVRMIDTRQEGDGLVMPWVSGIPATEYFRDLLKQDKAAFLRQLDAFWEIITRSGTPAAPDEADRERVEEGVILERGYLDLVSLNCFYVDGEFVFYDQELYLENVPAGAIMLRTVEFIYKFHDQLDGILPRESLFERYGIKGHRALYERVIEKFLDKLRGDRELSDYFRKGRREYGTVLENRRRMNYSEEEYEKIFKDIFGHIEGHRLYLFGSGKYAGRFREEYGELYPVAGYLDNDKSRWGLEVDGLLVSAPCILKEMDSGEYKVIVCVKNYLPVVNQLRREGITNFSVYSPNID